MKPSTLKSQRGVIMPKKTLGVDVPKKKMNKCNYIIIYTDAREFKEEDIKKGKLSYS